MNKLCVKCNQLQSNEAFYKNKTRTDGLSVYCKKCCNKTGKERYYQKWTEHRERIDNYHYKRIEYLRWQIDKIKTEKGCCICGYNKHPLGIDFHHINPSEKTLTIANMINRKYADTRILEEIAKCCVLCAICHRLYHNGIICGNMTPCLSVSEVQQRLDCWRVESRESGE